ncbi:MAG: Spx/MgsR family RNA polymerase-binding regulatory protein [Candidatus Omnitrophica bacterium]|nr:Spx/MgsR family RNA polymerase-binding regulatory protein [Candidatus Omnitrophota bacterium]
MLQYSDMIQFYGYNKCSSCLKAKKLFKEHAIPFEDIDITSHPPAKKLLQAIVKSGDYTLRQLFNTSGQLYREMRIKEKIGDVSETELVDLLSKHGKLVKRPLISDGKRYSVGYREEQIRKIWL